MKSDLIAAFLFFLIFLTACSQKSEINIKEPTGPLPAPEDTNVQQKPQIQNVETQHQQYEQLQETPSEDQPDTADEYKEGSEEDEIKILLEDDLDEAIADLEALE